MAKLVAPLWPIALLLVTLAVIVYHPNSVCTCNTECSSGKSKDVNEIETTEAIEIKEKTEEHWTELAKALAKMLPERKLWKVNRMSYEEAVSKFNELEDALSRVPHLKPASLGMSKSWTSLLHLREQTLKCEPNSIERIVNHATGARGNPWQFHYVLDCLRGFLINCGHEKHYRKAMDNVEHEHRLLRNCPTLDSFLRDQFWAKTKDKSSSFNKDELESILSVFEELAQFESIYNETACRDLPLWTRLARLLNDSKSRYPKLFELVGGYIALRLRECGFEGRFKAVLAKHALDSDQADLSLASYLWADFSKCTKKSSLEAEKSILRSLEIVDNLYEWDQIDEFDCDENTTLLMGGLLRDAKAQKKSKFVTCLEDTFVNYLTACTDDFKVRANEFVSTKKDSWAFIKKFAQGLETEIKDEHALDGRPSRMIIKQKLLNDFEPAVSSRENIWRLKVDCGALWQHMGPTIHAMSYDFSPAIEETEIKQFMSYLGLCCLARMDQCGPGSPVVAMFDKLATPYYPTKAPAPTLKKSECRRF